MSSLLKTPEVAAKLNCSESFVLKLARSGQLRALKLGSHWRFYADDVNAYQQRSVFTPAQSRSIGEPKIAAVPGLPILDRILKRRGTV